MKQKNTKEKEYTTIRIKKTTKNYLQKYKKKNMEEAIKTLIEENTKRGKNE